MDTTATTDETESRENQLFDEFVAFKAFMATTNQSSQPPDTYSARAFMASAQVNNDYCLYRFEYKVESRNHWQQLR